MGNKTKKYHEQLLYPVVRVHGKDGGGSGTVIYSKPDPEDKDSYLNFVLTNHHVIASLIDRKEEWDGLLKRKIEKEFTEYAKVECFDYVNTSKVVSSNAHRAEIVAYDEQHDLAVLRLLTPKPLDYVSKLIDKDKTKDLLVFDEICICGCSLLHDPIARFGRISYVDEVIDQKKFTMVDAGMYFGNSGGALFVKDSGELVGVPSRVSIQQLGFGFDVITWMGFCIAPAEIYSFLDDQELMFLYDEEDTYWEALERRELRSRQALLELKAETLKHAGD